MTESMRVPLTQGKVTIIDAADWPLVSQYACHAVRQVGPSGHVRWYACASIGNEHPGLHRVLMGACPGEIIDHKNGDGLDNRRENLRFCTAAQNNQNRRVWPQGQTSRYRGVWYRNGRITRPWESRISVENKRLFLGSFATEFEAALVYDEAARWHYGEFALVNFPDGLGEAES